MRSVDGGGPTPAHNGHSPKQPGHSVTGGRQARGRPIAEWRCFKAQGERPRDCAGLHPAGPEASGSRRGRWWAGLRQADRRVQVEGCKVQRERRRADAGP